MTLLSSLWRKLAALIARENGNVFPFTIILMTTGTLLLVPLLSYLSVLYRGYRVEREQMLMRFAAESAIDRVIADLRRGADVVPTTYVVEQPHVQNQNFSTFTLNTNYPTPSLTINDYSVVITMTNPTVSPIPVATQQYIDPGLANPQFATLSSGYAFLVRFFQVKAGYIQVNWAYQPAGISRVGVWSGFPVDPQTQQPYPPGLIDRWPVDHPILDTGNTPANVTYNRGEAVPVTPGVYSIVFDNSRGVSTKTTAPFAPSGGTGDTWIYMSAYRDYVVSATAQDVTVSAYLRQIPGYSQAPATAWSPTNSAWVDNKVYVYSWNPP